MDDKSAARGCGFPSALHFVPEFPCHSAPVPPFSAIWRPAFHPESGVSPQSGFSSASVALPMPSFAEFMQDRACQWTNNTAADLCFSVTAAAAAADERSRSAKRRRNPKNSSCVYCQSTHRKCGLQRPSCDRCMRASRPCVYPVEDRSSSPNHNNSSASDRLRGSAPGESSRCNSRNHSSSGGDRRSIGDRHHTHPHNHIHRDNDDIDDHPVEEDEEEDEDEMGDSNRGRNARKSTDGRKIAVKASSGPAGAPAVERLAFLHSDDSEESADFSDTSFAASLESPASRVAASSSAASSSLAPPFFPLGPSLDLVSYAAGSPVFFGDGSSGSTSATELLMALEACRDALFSSAPTQAVMRIVLRTFGVEQDERTCLTFLGNIADESGLLFWNVLVLELETEFCYSAEHLLEHMARTQFHGFLFGMVSATVKPRVGFLCCRYCQPGSFLRGHPTVVGAELVVSCSRSLETCLGWHLPLLQDQELGLLQLIHPDDSLDFCVKCVEPVTRFIEQEPMPLTEKNFVCHAADFVSVRVLRSDGRFVSCLVSIWVVFSRSSKLPLHMLAGLRPVDAVASGQQTS